MSMALTSIGTTTAETVLIGGGPAGTALLIAASRTGALAELAGAGLTVVERGPALGGGALAGYGIGGDSTAETFLTATAASAGPELARLASHPAARAIAARLGDGTTPSSAVPLVEVAAYLAMIGADLTRRTITDGGSVLTGTTAIDTRRCCDGSWLTRVRRPDGAIVALPSRQVVIATGGRQTNRRMRAEMLAGRSLADWSAGRSVPSGRLLASGGLAQIAARLRGIPAPKIVVVGSSTSALAACRVLLDGGLAGAPTPANRGGLTLLHRRPLRVFYPSAEAALADGYGDFSAADICPVSGFVFRLGGFRMEARDLVRQALRVGGRTPDPRLSLHCMTGPDDRAASHLLAEADLVVHALGYEPRALPVLNSDGAPWQLAMKSGGAMVDARGRVRDRTGQAIPGLFGLGLAAGFVPSGPLGGEPSFSGQANGLWLWQNDAGGRIVEQLTAPLARRQAA